MHFEPNTLVLFDVDGTLTEARQIISRTVLIALRDLCRHAEIGFVTGSDLDYIKEQMWPVLNDPIIKINSHQDPIAPIKKKLKSMR
jgi:hydroxymethylpyrimidine pyrophosphatase-like HAD family hydrolase